MKFSYYLWALYLIVFPFYVFSEGNPQIADIFGAVLIVFNLKPILQNFMETKFTRYLLYFVVYSILVNTVWMVIIGEILIIRNSVYYIYCFLFLMFIYNKIQEEGFLKFTLRAIYISLIIQLFTWPLVGDQGPRTQLFFNNPNQLALWGLTLLIVINAINIIVKEKFAIILAASLLCTFFILLSASKSAVVSSLLFWIFFYVKSRKNIIILTCVILIAFIYGAVSGNIQIENIKLLNYIVDRLSSEQISGDSGLAGRGFDRLVEFPQYLFFGAGEGQEERFNSDIELHSTFLNLLFSYGVLGLFFFGKAVLSLFTKSHREVIILFLIISIFSQVHMILRIPLFWATLIILFYVKTYMNKEESEYQQSLAINKT